MKFTIRLNPPKELESEWGTSNAFKSWMTYILSYLMQEADYRHFLKGGIYANWIAASQSKEDI